MVPNHHESAFFSWRRSMSSPDWNMSVTMSHPPTNSPSTYNCGMVGQSLGAEQTHEERSHRFGRSGRGG